MKLIALLLALLLAAPATPAAPPTDSQVDAAITELKKRLTGLEPPGLFEQRAKGIHELVGALGVKELSLAQIEKLKGEGMLTDPTMRQDIFGRLAELSKSQDDSGAIAAVFQMDFVSPEPESAQTPEQKALARKALGDAAAAAILHPGIRAAWDKSKALEVLGRLERVNPASLSKPAVIDALEKALAPGATPEVIRRLPALMESLGSEAAAIEPALLERIRVRAAALTEDVKPTSPQDEKAIKILRSFFAGAMCRGILLGKPAPALDFTWTPVPPAPPASEPGKGESPVPPAPKSLADLKGKVAVLVFWHAQARTAGRAILGAESLRIRYKDSPVNIVLLTSLQGHGTDYTEPRQPKKVDTSSNPQLEYDLTAKLLALRKSSCQLAFCSEVYNPDFGVVRVPVVAVIDPAGVVRMRSGDLRESFDDICTRIDKVLDEFKLPKPPPGPISPVPPQPAAAQPSQATPAAPAPVAPKDAPGQPDKGG